MEIPTLAQLISMGEAEREGYLGGLEPQQHAFENFALEIYGYLLRQIEHHEYPEKQEIVDLIYDIRSIRRSLYDGLNPFSVAVSAAEMAFSLAKFAVPGKLKVLKTADKRKAANDGHGKRAGRYAGNMQWFIDEAMEKLIEMVESKQYPGWKHPEYLEDIRTIHPYSEVQINSWWEKLRKKFLEYLREHRPDIVKEH